LSDDFIVDSIGIFGTCVSENVPGIRGPGGPAGIRGPGGPAGIRGPGGGTGGGPAGRAPGLRPGGRPGGGGGTLLGNNLLNPTKSLAARIIPPLNLLVLLFFLFLLFFVKGITTNI
jgi:hypothetical protein